MAKDYVIGTVGYVMVIPTFKNCQIYLNRQECSFGDIFPHNYLYLSYNLYTNIKIVNHTYETSFRKWLTFSLGSTFGSSVWLDSQQFRRKSRRMCGFIRL